MGISTGGVALNLMETELSHLADIVKYCWLLLCLRSKIGSGYVICILLTGIIVSLAHNIIIALMGIMLQYLNYLV